MPDVVRPFVLPKGNDGVLHLALLDHVCYSKVMMACHARRRSIVYAVQRR